MNAYAPGLKVLRRRHRCRRVLPIAGTVLVRSGETVQAQTAIAQTDLPGAVAPVNLAHLLGSPPTKSPGDDPCTRSDRLSGQEKSWPIGGSSAGFRRQCVSPVDGTIEAVSGVTGQVMLRGPSRPALVAAFLAGNVIEVLPREGAVIEADATFIQGIFGIGGEATVRSNRSVRQPPNRLWRRN